MDFSQKALASKSHEIGYYSGNISPRPDEEQDVFYGRSWRPSRPKRHTDMYNFYLNRIRHEIQDLVRGNTVLDVVCGASQEAEFLARVCGARVIGLDVAGGSVETAQRRAHNLGYANSFEGVVEDMENLPFHDKSIDVSVTHASLHHATDPFKVIDEMVRVSRKGLMILRESIDSISIRLGLMLKLTEKFEEDASGNEVWRVSASQLKKRLEAIAPGRVFLQTHWLNS